MLNSYLRCKNFLEWIDVNSPGFVYDLDQLQSHASQVLSKLPNRVKLFYACKANPSIHIINKLAEIGLHFDAASSGELAQIQRQGTKLTPDVILTGPSKSDALLIAAREANIKYFVIESINQFHRMQSLGIFEALKKNGGGLLIRVQARWQEDSFSVLGGASITQFGMQKEDALYILKHLDPNLFLGFHIFQWGNILCHKRLVDIWNKSIEFCKSIHQNFKVLDIGGGLGVPYKAGDNNLDFDALSNSLLNITQTHDIDIWMEIGRYLTASCGIYISRIIDKKTVYGKDMLILEGGINHLLRPALVKESFPMIGLYKTGEYALKQEKRYEIFGPLCTALDTLGIVELPECIAVGDFIAFLQVGAYGFTQSMPMFLCHESPSEGIIARSSISTIRRKNQSYNNPN